MRSMTFADFFRVFLPSKVIWGADFDSDIHFALRRLEMRSWNHGVIKGQWRHMTGKWFFAFCTLKNHPWAFKNHRIMFYSSQGTRWTLKFCSSSIRSKVIGDRGFSSLFDTWYLIYQSLRLAASYTLVFFPRSSSSIRGEMARGVVPTPPPFGRGRMRNGLCRRGLRS